MFSGYIAIGAVVLICLLGGLTYMQYERANSLEKTNAKQELEIKHNAIIITTLTNQFKLNQEKIDYISSKINDIHSNSVNKVAVFDNHNLEKLLEAKPKLIESLINKAIEKNSKRIEDITNPNWTPK